MECPKCKLINPGGTMRCDCGYDFPTGPNEGASGVLVSGLPSNDLYASFRQRAVACIVDHVLIYGILVSITGALSTAMSRPEEVAEGLSLIIGLLAFFVLFPLYYGLMESSSHQASLGKMVMGIIVTDLACQRASTARATGRGFAKILSASTLYGGYIIAGFTPKKQALHDLIAGCVVIRKHGLTVRVPPVSAHVS